MRTSKPRLWRTVLPTNTRDGMVALPDGAALIAFHAILRLGSDRDDLVPLRVAECQLEHRRLAEVADVGVPALARADGVVPVARLVHHLLVDAVIGHAQQEL